VAIELKHLRYVDAASRCGSFRRAAVHLGVDQSAISRRIRDLEDNIGAALFIRHSGGVVLTQAGKKFVCRARQALCEISCAAIEVGPFGRGEKGNVRIGISSPLASGFLPELLRDYSNRYKDVRIDVIEGAKSDLIADLRQYKLDVAFVSGPLSVKEYESAVFWTEGVYVGFPSEHVLAGRRALQWSDLIGETFIVSACDSGSEIHNLLVRRLANLSVRSGIESFRVGRDTLMQIVSFGRGVTLIGEATIATKFPGVAYRRLEDERLPFSAVWSPKNDNPAWRRMLSLARSASRRNGIRSSETAKVGKSSAVATAHSSRLFPALPSQIRDPKP
jgi:DNA-binding transcriptional LysR family regulator